MENLSKNNKRYKNAKLDNYKYKFNQEDKQNEFDLINDKIYDYKIKTQFNDKDNKEISNGSKLDRNNIKINKIENISNYHKTNKRPLFNRSLNQYCFDNNNNNNYNYDDYNNGGNKYYTQLNSNNNIPVSGNKNNHSIKISKYTKDSLSKNDSKKMSNMAKTLKMFSNKNTSENNFFYSNLGKNVGGDIEKTYFKNDLSSDKIKSNNIESRAFKNNKNIRNFEIHTNINFKSGEEIIDEKNDNKKNKDSISSKIDLQYKYLNEENKSKTPLRVNYRYNKNINNKIVGNNRINGGDNNSNDLSNKEEFKTKTIKNLLKKEDDDNKSAYSLNYRRKENKELDTKQYLDINNINNIKNNFNQNLRLFNDSKDNHNVKYINNVNKNSNKKVDIKDQSEGKSNLLIKNSNFTKSNPNMLKDLPQKNVNLNTKTMKTPKSIKESFDKPLYSSRSGKIEKINSLENIFDNQPYYNPREINNRYENISNNNIPKISINLEKNRDKKIANEINMNKYENKNNINNVISRIQINNDKTKKLNQFNIQNNIKNLSINNSLNNNSNNNITRQNGIDNNSIKNNNIYFNKQNTNNLIFHKKVNRSPPGFNKKLNNIYRTNNNCEIGYNNKPISKLNTNYHEINNLKTNIKDNNKFKTENNVNYYKYSKYNNNYSQDIPNNIINAEEKKLISRDSLKNTNTQNGPNGTIYKKQKAIKKKLIQKEFTKGKFDSKILNENNIINKDIINDYSTEKIKNKIIVLNKRMSKYYNFIIKYPIIKKCNFSKVYFKNIRIPKIEICNISKINTLVYIIYKNKPVCYYTKIRSKRITKPPVNEICECSKNIVLIPQNQNNKKTEEKKIIENNNLPLIVPKKTKKRKKRRKTRRLHNGKETNPNLLRNENNTSDDNNIEYDNNENKENNENNENENLENENNENNNGNDENNNEDNNIIQNKEQINDEIDKKKYNEYDINNDNNNNGNIIKDIEKISIINSNSLMISNNLAENKQINHIKNIINDKSSVYKSSNEEKSVFSEKEIILGDIEKNSLIKKKLSPTTYNDDEYNEEENDDFRFGSDEDLSDDKLKKKEYEKENKTEGKEILGDNDRNKNYVINKKLTDIEKKVKALELLEKIQGKRNSAPNDQINNHEFYIENERYNNINNKEEINQNILLGTNKLNEILHQKKNKFEDDEELMNIYNQEETENDDMYIDSNININYTEDDVKSNDIQKESNNSNSNNNINKRRNNTYKKKVDYEKIGLIFDKLEGIFDKKKSNDIENINNENVDNEKCKTPLLKTNLNNNNRIKEFNLKEDEYNYSNNENENDNDNENENDNDNDNESNNYNNENNENEYNNYSENENINEIINENSNENNEEYSDDKKSNNMMNKYKEILNNKQQILSKLESLMNKQKNNINPDDNIDINNYMFNSPKIESEIDSDMNINKDTPGNRKEIKKNNFTQNNNNYKKIFSIEEIFSYKNKKICQNTNLLTFDVISHCNEIINTIQENYPSFKKNYKDIIINTNNNYSINNNLLKNEKESMAKWARKDMTKEIKEAENYVKELNTKMSKDNLKHEIIEILNTLTVDNYKITLKKIIEILYLSENKDNNKIDLKKPEYLLHNQFIFVEIILDKATIEKGYVVLYAKLCADLFIELIKLIKEYNNPEIENQLIKGENLKTILTSECRQRFDECISISTLSKKLDDEEKNEIFIIFKKKFLGNMDFIAELINVKILSQTKGFEFLDILYKRYKEIKNNEKIKYLNLEGAVTLLTKFGRIIMERKNPKHIQNLDNYIKDNMLPIISNTNNNNENKNLPNYLKFKIINLIEKKKNDWKDSLYEQSIIAKGKNNNINNISLYHDGGDSIINIDESLIDCQKAINSNIIINQDKEENIIILLKNDIDNYVTFLNEHNIFSKKDLNEYYNKNENSDINNEYDWSTSEELIIKTKNELEEIIRCYIEVCIDYVTKENNIFYCNEYIKNIINYYSVDLTKDEIEKVNISMNDLYLNIEDICIDNFFMLEIMGYLMYILLNNNLYYYNDFNKFINEDKNKIIKIAEVIKYTIIHSDEKSKELFNKLKSIELFKSNETIFEENIVKPLKNEFNMSFD